MVTPKKPARREATIFYLTLSMKWRGVHPEGIHPEGEIGGEV